MLRSKDSPDGCPKLMFQSVALSVLSCFTQDEEIMTHPSVNFNIHLFINHLYNNKCFVRHGFESAGAIWCLLGFLESLWVPNEEFMKGVKEFHLIKKIIKFF